MVFHGFFPLLYMCVCVCVFFRLNKYIYMALCTYIQADGVVRAGGEQARAAIEVEKHRLQLEASRKPGQIFEHESKGSPRGKQNEVEEDAQVSYAHTHTIFASLLC
jgi:hypothetical protein